MKDWVEATVYVEWDTGDGTKDETWHRIRLPPGCITDPGGEAARQVINIRMSWPRPGGGLVDPEEMNGFVGSACFDYRPD